MKSVITFSLLVASVTAIWPLPSSYSSGSNTLWLDKRVKIVVNGVANVGSLIVQRDFPEYVCVVA
jgi:hexosaminidase